MARDDASFIRYLPFMVKLIPFMFQDGSLSLPNFTLCFAICVFVSMLTQVKSLGILLEMGFDSLNIIVMF